MKFLVSRLMTVYPLTESTTRCSTKIYRHKLLMPTITHLGSQPCFFFGRLLTTGKKKLFLVPSQRLRTLQDEVTEGREGEVGRERHRGRMHSSRVSLFIVATCLRLFQEEDVSSQGRVPLFHLLHGRQTSAPAGLLRPSARMRSTISFIHLRSESLPLIQALSAPVSACFSFGFFFFF